MRRFIVRAVTGHPGAITSITSRHFGISRQAVNRQLDQLVAQGLLDVTGFTKGRTYSLRTLVSEEKMFEVSRALHEDVVWSEDFASHLEGLQRNVQNICSYGFTEMLNNVIDHSESPDVRLELTRNAVKIAISIFDHGVGIFNKIQKACRLETPRIAIFELTKGKFTTDPDRHTGEGIFFTSRVFDSFAILSGDLFLAHDRGDRDWLVETRRERFGTSIFLELDPQSDHTVEEVLTHYASEQDDYAFNKTTIAVRLAVTEGEQLVSRSQAKRVSARLDKFKEVALDFQGISSIGPAFADELFRVFQNRHPHVNLIPINANEEVTRMIRRALTGAVLEETERTPSVDENTQK